MTSPLRFLLPIIIVITGIPGLVSAQLFEDFESGSKGAYSAGTVELESGPWLLDEALLGNQSGDKRIGSQSVRMQGEHISMEFDTNGAGEVRFYHANAGFSGDTGGRLQLQYSQDGGGSWIDAGQELVCPDGDLEQASIDIGQSGSIRFRIPHTAGGRISIDHFQVTEFIEETDDARLHVEFDGEATEA